MPRLLCLSRLLSLAVLILSMSPTTAQSADVREEIREQLDSSAATAKVAAPREALLSTSLLSTLYTQANFEPQWVPAQVNNLLNALEQLRDDGLNPADYHFSALRELNQNSSKSFSDRARLDLLASDGLALAITHLYAGKVDPRSLDPNWNFNSKPVTDAAVLEAVKHALSTGNIAGELDAARPGNAMYGRGREFLKSYRQIAARGGWPHIANGPALKPGMTDSRVPALRARLAAEGFIKDGTDTSTLYDPALKTAVQQFQERHLLEADGNIGAGTLKELNLSAEERVNQIRVNLERARWVLHEIGNEDHVLVDIAGYGVRYMHEQKAIWQSKVIVGQPFRKTPSFRAEIQYVVFNPTWTVPPGILEKDILPMMKKGVNVLDKKHLKVIDNQGRPVDPKSIVWSHYSARNFPYMLRQDAGDENALGRVKIMFPNPYLVYLHDTPSRSLFEKDRRNFSSGCIRVQKPLELAERVLADPAAWNPASIDAVVASGETRTVNLKRKIPVLLIYWTVDQDASGATVFKPDVYNEDAPLLKALDGTVVSRKRKAA